MSNFKPLVHSPFSISSGDTLNFQVIKNVEGKTHQHIDARSKARYLSFSIFALISILNFVTVHKYEDSVAVIFSVNGDIDSLCIHGLPCLFQQKPIVIKNVLPFHYSALQKECRSSYA